MKLINKQMLDIAKGWEVSKYSRPVAKDAYFDGEKMVITDGYVLIEYQLPRDAEISENFPLQEAVKDINPRLIPIMLLKEIARLLPRGRKASLPILKHAAITRDAKDIEISVTDLEKTSKISVKKIDGKFPNYANIVPKKKPKAKLKINRKLLIKALKNCPDDDLYFEMFDKNSPMVIRNEPKSKNGKFMALVMPLKDLN